MQMQINTSMPDNSELFPSLGFLQFPIVLADPGKNLEQVRSGLARLRQTDGALIVLPELWSTGFAYGRFDELAAGSGEILQELAGLAGRYNCLLAGSLPELVVNGHESYLYNTLYIVGTDGIFGSYRKQQVFAFGGEGKAFTSGFEPRPVVTPRGRIGCLVCYDLRFPELARSQCQQGADLLICSAQWPAVRREHWRTLLRARALENQTFLVACNACGLSDGMELGGYSAIIDPEGKVLFEAAGCRSSVSLQPSWMVRESYRARFTSFAVAAYAFADEGKICRSAADCLDLVSLRRGVGQRIVYCAIGQSAMGQADLDALQDARRQGDFLLVGVLPAEGGSAVAKEEGDRADQVDGKEEILRCIAALGCVDAVCLLEDFSDDDLVRLGELLSRNEIPE
jgi:D-glycero-beta-D-manno-heptose 1-phosphate adenylyltransferase